MPLMIHGVSYNKPLQHGKTLNACHAGHVVWPQNHQMGAASASASTLGTVYQKEQR